MFQRLLPAIATLVVLAMPGVSTHAAENNYLALQLDYAQLDNARRVDGSGLGATFLYGFPIRERFFLETRITGLVLERGDTGGTDFYQQDIGVDGIYRFGTSSGWQPFVLAGAAVIRNDVDIDEQDDVGLGVHAGGGIISRRMGGLGLRFRADLRYVHDPFLDGMQDVRLGIGIQVPLGNASAAGSSSLAAASTLPSDDDRDADGVSDGVDRCLNSLPYVRHDTNGCMQPGQTIRLYEVTFTNGTSILTQEARAQLGELVLALRGQPDLPVRVNGHTDSWGDKQENEQLSLERAEAVATWLTLQGIPTQRLHVKGFGETMPVDTNATADGRKRNRRIEVVLLEPESHQ